MNTVTESTRPEDRQGTRGNEPPLNNGDHLSRAEFEWRYAAQPEIKKAELIEGVVYVPSPVYPRHGEHHSAVSTWLGVYRAATPGIRVYANTSLRLDTDNEPQPDLCVLLDPTHTIDPDQLIEARPVLIVEVASSSASYDLHQKFHVYRRNAVQEYLVLLVHEQESRWYRWQEGDYDRIAPDSDGVLRSHALPGLRLHSDRFWRGDLAGVLAILQDGIDSLEHMAFVQSPQEGTQ